VPKKTPARFTTRVVVEPRRDVLAQHAAFFLGHAPHLEGKCAINEGRLDEEVPDVAGVGAA
jgi:hypothetical protein